MFRSGHNVQVGAVASLNFKHMLHKDIVFFIVLK